MRMERSIARPGPGCCRPADTFRCMRALAVEIAFGYASVSVLAMRFRSNLPHRVGQGYDPAEMRSLSCLTLVLMMLGCASETSNTARQLREQQERIKRLTTTCDRLEERVLALEAAAKGIGKGARVNAQSEASRPDLPTIKVAPDSSETGPAPSSEAAPDATADDDRRVVIVGEGSRVEARTAGESSSSVGARPTGKANSRASKANQGSLPKASNSGAPQ